MVLPSSCCSSAWFCASAEMIARAAAIRSRMLQRGVPSSYLLSSSTISSSRRMTVSRYSGLIGQRWVTARTSNRVSELSFAALKSLVIGVRLSPYRLVGTDYSGIPLEMSL